METSVCSGNVPWDFSESRITSVVVTGLGPSCLGSALRLKEVTDTWANHISTPEVSTLLLPPPRQQRGGPRLRGEASDTGWDGLTGGGSPALSRAECKAASCLGTARQLLYQQIT